MSPRTAAIQPLQLAERGEEFEPQRWRERLDDCGVMEARRRETTDHGEHLYREPHSSGYLRRRAQDPSDAFEYLSARVATWIAEGSRGGRLAYIEAEYFGGTGAQAAIGFEGGTVTLAATRSEDVGPINSALRFLGVACTSTQDEFESVGLARHRRLEEWK
jgi:hypothetical protein